MEKKHDVYIFIAVVAVLALVFALYSSRSGSLKSSNESLEEKVAELQDEIDSLSMKYESAMEKIHSTEDSLIDLISFFEDKSISFDAAYNSFQDLKDTLYDFY